MVKLNTLTRPNWKEREEQAAADAGFSTRQQYRMRLLNWPTHVIGDADRVVRKGLFDRQTEMCPLCNEKLDGPRGDVDHIRPKKEFVNDDVPILEAIKACWAFENMRLVHPKCHKDRYKNER